MRIAIMIRIEKIKAEQEELETVIDQKDDSGLVACCERKLLFSLQEEQEILTHFLETLEKLKKERKSCD